MTNFEPIAIIGQGCLLPGANSPQELWELSANNRCALAPMTEQACSYIPELNPADKTSDTTWTTQAGCIDNFDQYFDPTGFAVPAEEIATLDNIFRFPLSAAKQALDSTQYTIDDLKTISAGIIFGNLSYPSCQLARMFSQYWLGHQKDALLKNLIPQHIDPRNRFMSGYPAHLVAKAMNLTGSAYTLDAACASSIYAIKLACDELHSRKADLILAGGVNAVDMQMLSMGFVSLQALSKTGRSQPFTKEADGLVPAQGSGFFVLQRLQDAVQQQQSILGVIRGIGLSNDGNSSGGLLASSKQQQQATLRQAYAIAGIDPQSIDYIDCHATGTQLGDTRELESINEFFNNRAITVAALKANIGHALSSSGIAALIRMLEAIRHKQLPPTLLQGTPSTIFSSSNLHTLSEPAEWKKNDDSPRRAALNAFGMGGNNAHIIIEEWQQNRPPINAVHFKKESKEDIAIVAISCRVGKCDNVDSYAEHLLNCTALHADSNDYAERKFSAIPLPIIGLRFPPIDLKQTLGQHLSILEVGSNAFNQLKHLPKDKTSVLIGMQCDPEMCRPIMRWSLPLMFNAYGIEPPKSWTKRARDQVCHLDTSAVIVDGMPNVPASRLSMQFDCLGPSLSVCSEELSGTQGLNIAINWLQNNEIDAALVGAVDLSCEPVHHQAAKAVLPKDKQNPGDAAVALVLKRLSDAKKDNETIYGIFSTNENAAAKKANHSISLTDSTHSHLFGHSHVASGLLHVLDAVIIGLAGEKNNNETFFPARWRECKNTYQSTVTTTSFSGQQQSINVSLPTEEIKPQSSTTSKRKYRLHLFAGETQQQLLDHLHQGIESTSGDHRLSIIASSETELNSKKELAKELISASNGIVCRQDKGIYYYPQAINGKAAVVFASSNTSYHMMGVDLINKFPDFHQIISQYYSNLDEIISWIHGETFICDNFQYEIKTTLLLSWYHWLFLQNILQFKPENIMGHSVGEGNALFVLNIFKDHDQADIYGIESKLYSHLLDNDFEALKLSHKNLDETQISWQNWRLLGDLEQTKALLKDNPLCHLSIINTDDDFVIAGTEIACKTAIDQINPAMAKKLRLNFMVHCPEVQSVADIWRKQFVREIHPNPDFTLHSCITGEPYSQEPDSIADNMLQMGTQCVDFPRLIRNAWENGVRTFVEIGPQNLCSHWIKSILSDKQQDYVITSMDQAGRSSLLQPLHAAANLYASGADININLLEERIY